jgi:hypothetical protein
MCGLNPTYATNSTESNMSSDDGQIKAEVAWQQQIQRVAAGKEREAKAKLREGNSPEAKAAREADTEALLAAAERADLVGVKKAIKAGAFINFEGRPEQWLGALHLAANSGKKTAAVAVIEYLLGMGARTDIGVARTETSHCIARYGQVILEQSRRCSRAGLTQIQTANAARLSWWQSRRGRFQFAKH